MGVKKRRYVQAVLIVLLVLICSSSAGCKKQKQNDVAGLDFDEVREIARGRTVRFYMWGGDAKINSWIDRFVAEKVDEYFDIGLKRVPMDASVFVTKLLNEKLSGKEDGIMDLLWINGENFSRAKEAGLLYGPFSHRLPSFDYCNPEEVNTDFGFPVEGYEAPYGKAQFVFEYDAAQISKLPVTPEKLLRWAGENPGRFTYPQPPDFTGSAFIRQLFYLLTGGHEQYMERFDEELYSRNVTALWDYLNEIKPFLWKEGATYPQGKSQLDFLFERGEVSFNMSYHQAAAYGKVLDGRYPETVRTFVFSKGSISNIHFTAIPFNSQNKAAAMVVADFLLSPEAQYSKNLAENWGDFTVLDLGKLPGEYRDRFENIDLGESTLPISVLNEHAVPEIPTEYVERLEIDWEEQVLQGPSGQ